VSAALPGKSTETIRTLVGLRVAEENEILSFRPTRLHLIRVNSVMLILGIPAALAAPRYIDLETAATVRAIDAAVSEPMAGRPSTLTRGKSKQPGLHRC